MPSPRYWGGEKARWQQHPMRAVTLPPLLPSLDYCCRWYLWFRPLVASRSRTRGAAAEMADGVMAPSPVFLSLSLWWLCCRHARRRVLACALEEYPFWPCRSEWWRLEYWTYCWRSGMSRPWTHTWPLGPAMPPSVGHAYTKCNHQRSCSEVPRKRSPTRCPAAPYPSCWATGRRCCCSPCRL